MFEYVAYVTNDFLEIEEVCGIAHGLSFSEAMVNITDFYGEESVLSIKMRYVNDIPVVSFDDKNKDSYFTISIKE